MTEPDLPKPNPGMMAQAYAKAATRSLGLTSRGETEQDTDTRVKVRDESRPEIPDYLLVNVGEGGRGWLYAKNIRYENIQPRLSQVHLNRGNG